MPLAHAPDVKESSGKTGKTGKAMQMVLRTFRACNIAFRLIEAQGPETLTKAKSCQKICVSLPELPRRRDLQGPQPTGIQHC